MVFDCTICREPLVTQEVCATRCGHVFHRMCLVAWMQYKRSCPYCRAPSDRKNLLRIFFPVVAPSSETGDEALRPTAPDVNCIVALKRELQSAKYKIQNLEARVANYVRRDSVANRRNFLISSIVMW